MTKNNVSSSPAKSEKSDAPVSRREMTELMKANLDAISGGTHVSVWGSIG